MNQAWKRLTAEGVDVWIDASATTEGAAREVRRALAQGEVTGARLGGPHGRSAAGTCPADEIRSACDQLLPRHRASGGAGGLVSVPLPAGPAAGADAWVARARAVRDEVGRPNLVVRLPAEAAGTATLRALFALDIAVEVAGVSSPRRYGQVATALLAALDESTRSASFISFDVTGVERHVDARLDLIGSDEAKALRGRAGLACARLAHRTHEMTFSSARWGALAAAGAREPKLLWATGAASPARAAHAVQELVTRGTATAMTPAAARVLAESGTVSGDRVWRHYADAERTLAYLDWFGVPVESLVESLADGGGSPVPYARAHRAAPVGATTFRSEAVRPMTMA
ncbi:transaldolase family protein [Streptomyces sp. NPDC046465]|uniref:transaldolase family protein n=1 Tax=Streptomyces sp. NPDC046465 TaxID=3155810 RepID=UPI0033F036CE